MKTKKVVFYQSKQTFTQGNEEYYAISEEDHVFFLSFDNKWMFMGFSSPGWETENLEKLKKITNKLSIKYFKILFKDAPQQLKDSVMYKFLTDRP